MPLVVLILCFILNNDCVIFVAEGTSVRQHAVAWGGIILPLLLYVGLNIPSTNIGDDIAHQKACLGCGKEFAFDPEK